MSKRPRGKDVKRMDKPYTCREVLHTCSNGWTIERVSPEDFRMEGFFMGHCLGADPITFAPGAYCPSFQEVLSLREPDGTPHATITDGVMVGRGNQTPKEKYCVLIQECIPDARPNQPTKFALAYRRPENESL